jgi:hypothetical protein
MRIIAERLCDSFDHIGITLDPRAVPAIVAALRGKKGPSDRNSEMQLIGEPDAG